MMSIAPLSQFGLRRMGAQHASPSPGVTGRPRVVTIVVLTGAIYPEVLYPYQDSNRLIIGRQVYV